MRRLSTALISATCLGLVLTIAPAVQAASLAAPTWTPAHRLNSATGTGYLDGPHVAASSSGAAVTSWVALRYPHKPRRRTVAVYAAVKSTAGAWMPPHRLAVARGRASVTRGANAAWVGIDRRGRAMVLWTTPDLNAADFWLLHWSRHLPGGTWSRPAVLATTIYKYDVVRPDFAMAPSGRGMLAYAQPSTPRTPRRSGNVGFVRRFFPDGSWGRPIRITSATPPAPQRGGIGVTHMSAGISDTGAVTAIWLWQTRLTSQGPVDRGERGGVGPHGRRLRIEPADRSGGGDIAVSPNGSVAYLAGGAARRLVTRAPGGAWTTTALPGDAGTTPFSVEFALSDAGVTLWWVSVGPGGTGSAERLSTSDLRADGTWTDPAVLYRSTVRAVVEVHGARGGADTDVAWFTRPQQGIGTGHTTLRSTSPGGVTTVHTTSNGPRWDLAAAGDHAVFAWENRVPRGAEHPVWTKSR